MSRIEYNDNLTDAQLALQVGQELQTIHGKRSRKFLVELEQALLELPTKRLIPHVLCDERGEYCALGLVAMGRLVQAGASIAEAELLLQVDPMELRNYDGDQDTVVYAVKELGISQTLAWLVVEANDNPEGPSVTPEQRYTWVLRQARRMLAGKLPVDRLP